MSCSIDLSFNFSFGNNSHYKVVAVTPVGIITILFDAMLVLICSSSSCQNVEVDAESVTMDLLLSIVTALFSISLSNFSIYCVSILA